MTLIPELDHYLSQHKDEFLFCQDKRKLKITPVKKGEEAFVTFETQEVRYKTQEDGYQIEFFGIKAFFNQSQYEKANLGERNLILFAYHQLQENVISSGKVLPKGSYVIYQVEERDDGTNTLKNPKGMSAEEFERRFNKICLVELARITGMKAPTPRP